MAQKIKIKQVLPMMFAFVLTGFVDIIGVATGYVKLDLAVYGVTSQLGVFWLSATPNKESNPDRKPASFASCLGLYVLYPLDVIICRQELIAEKKIGQPAKFNV